MKRSKGFTLIELLAVIVILAVIALIAIPQVLNILNKARLSAAEDTTYGIVKSAENYVTEFMLQNNGNFVSDTLEFKCENKKCELQNILENYNTENLTVLEFKGTKPTSGIVTISDNGKTIVAENLIINGFTCNYSLDGKAKCDGVGSNNTNENTTTTTTTTTTTVVEVGPTCVETCYWYYTETFHPNDSTGCSSVGEMASESCYESCTADGVSNCSERCSSAYQSAYDNCINATATRTVYYVDASSNKIEYSCDTPPSSKYTNFKVANSCE